MRKKWESLYQTLDVLVPNQHYGVCCLTQGICEKLSEVHQVLIEGLEVKTSFEPLPESRNFFQHVLEMYGGSAILIAIAVPYRVTKPTNGNVGFIEGGASGEDYHRCVKQKLLEVSKGVADKLPIRCTDEVAYYVDTSPFIDREIAFIAGLGKYGRHHQLMTVASGARFNIGYAVYPATMGYLSLQEEMLESARLMERMAEDRLFSGCHSCDACITACPVGICGGEQMARERCISYITQKKAPLSRQEQMAMGYRIYGCSHCIYACPYEPEPMETTMGEVDLIQGLELSQRSFKRIYGNTGIAWRGLRIFKRNCMIVLNNLGLTLPEADKERFCKDDFYKPYIK